MPAPANALKARYDAAAAALRSSDWLRAEQLATSLITDIPSHPTVFFIAGAAALELRRYPRAVECLSRATDLDPDRAECFAELSRALVALRRFAEASVAAGKALALSPRDPKTLDSLGVVFSRLDEHDKAKTVFQRMVDAWPRHAGYRFNLATSLVFTGDAGGAEIQLEECLALDPRFWKAYPALAGLRKQSPERNHVERLRAALADATDPGAATYLHMALAKESEDLGQYASAFEHLVDAKAPLRAAKGYSISRDEAMFEAIEREYAGPAPPAAGHQSRLPIFVFGMPRSGTTLVERILSSHPEVQSVGESEIFAMALKRASGSATPSMLDADTVSRSRALDWAGVGSLYMAAAATGMRGNTRFVDKLPQNFLYAGYIANALPMARMVCVRRDPMDTCLGNFRQLFAQMSSYYDYSLDMLDIGRYYILFDRLMSYWERLLPGRILTLRYETMVRGQEACTRQLLDFCGLDWHDACLGFDANPAPVSSASALQVREPMNSGSIGRWKNYEPQLAPLRRLLEDAGIEIRD